MLEQKPDKGLAPSIIEHFNDPVVVLSHEGMVIDHNPSFALMAGREGATLKDTDGIRLSPLSKIRNVLSASLSNKSYETGRLYMNERHYEATISPAVENDKVVCQVIMYRDITRFISLEEELTKRNRDLMISNSLAGTFINSDDISIIHEELLSKAMAITEMPIGMIVLHETSGIRVECSRGLSIALRGGMEAGKLDGFLKGLFISESPMDIMGGRDDGMPDEMWNDGIRFCASIPLRSHGDNIGLLILASKLEVSLDFDLASMLSVTGNIMSLLADKIMLFNEAKKLSITDALTGLYNARHFYEELARGIERYHRYGDSFSIILYDIDNFKDVNDTFGHQAGDEVLRSVASILVGSVRMNDFVARYGGEEFIIILPETAKDKAAAFAERIRIAVANSIFLRHEGGLEVTLSGGVAACPLDATTAKSLLYLADMAMYKAKEQGKNRIICFEPEVDESKNRG